jgi:amino acid adenylation domain-containing protein
LAGSERVSFDTDRPRPSAVSFRGARRQLELPEATWRRLETVASRDDATLAMLLFAALALLLRNHSGHDDLVIGLPIANRNHADSLNCFGCLVNTLAVRIALVGDGSFAQLLREVRRQFLDAFNHQDMPFEVLIGQLHLERDPILSPLFGVMLNMLNTPAAQFDMPGIAVERMELDRRGAQFDLTLTVDRLHTRSIWFEYATDLYDVATIDRIMARFAALLDAVQENPGRSLDGMPQRTNSEAARIRGWSVGPPAASTGVLAHDLIAGAARQRPDSCAVRCGARMLTYGELQRRAAALAYSLLQRTPQRDVRIGLMLGRSTDLPVAILGALMAGVTFVPLDPAFPDERLAYIAADAGLSLILTDSDAAADRNWIPPGVAVSTTDELVSAGDPCFTPAPRPDAHPAYVLYTSGTTGHPKGVQIPGYALANFLYAMRTRPGIGETDRLLAVTTLSFDISLLELLLPLAVGAQVVIAGREQARDGQALAEMIQAHDITLMQGTPSTWFQLLESGWKGRATLRALVGGEPLPRELADRLRPLVLELWNMYGPTETTVWSSCTLVDGEQEITIGTPIAGTVMEILDSRGRPAGIGMQGEIVIGGAGLASGYVNRPELTNARFQFLTLDGDAKRYYHTGDVGSWTAAGQIRIAGRSDRQVKLRGHRIEPGEIEASALRIPGIQRAVVTTHVGSSQDVRLALYVVPRDAAHFDAANVRTQLKTWLPDYMIPQLVIAMESVPQLANGKVDLRRLPQLTPSSAPQSNSLPPQSHDEMILQSLWKELLGIEKIDRDQDFFELGGHSLLAMRLVTRVREELQRHCTLAQVFQNPTIASLSAVLSDAAPLTSRTLVALQTEGDGPPLFCICGVQLYRPLVAHLALDAPVFATYVPMVDTLDVATLAREYLVTIRAQQPQGPYRLLGFSLGGVLAYEIAQQLRADGERIQHLSILDSDVPGEAATSIIGVLKSLRKVLAGSGAANAEMPGYLRAIRAYQPRPYSGNATYVEATAAEHFAPGYDWTDLIPGLEVIAVQSEHIDLMSEKQVAIWAPALKTALEQSQRISSWA